ncbi:hypothetical protein CK203_041736 [Vitis vinifera]|uniref:Uncharacterized protein n=1 Tax=Vitis vinifera TaxID=29760 RepID=A0A438HCQ7_VITVI|nr:hypothetical protein CK203_041736 [Vitis vinifera]
MANARVRRNFLSKIRVNGVNLSSLEDIKEGVCRAYQSLISNSGDWRPSINGLNFKELREGLASSLKEFYIHGTFQRSLNSTFLLLIPKKEGTEDLRNFKPINLVGSMYKLLAKVLANRLKLVMGEISCNILAGPSCGLMRFQGVYLPPTWVFPLEPPINPRGCGMQWKKDSGKGCLSEKTIPLQRVCAMLEKIQRDFLWGGGALEKKPHLVSWKVICAAKKDGGLGIRSLATFNKALLRKWLWRFANRMSPYGSKLSLVSMTFKRRDGAPKEGVDDLLRWKENKNETFSVKSFYSSFSRASSPPSRLELFGRLGFQLGLASLVGRRLGAGYSPLTT